MKKMIVLAALLGLVATTVGAEQADLSGEEKIGYAIGMNIGINMKRQKVEVDSQQLAAGLKAAYSGSQTLLSEAAMGEILMAYQQEMQAKQQAEMAAASVESTAMAEAFLAENSKQEGVIILDSGLQYKLLASGAAATPKADSKVEVHYRGTLLDGTEFDSSYKRGKPASFPVGGVIAGWTEALQLMKEGDKWQLAIPPALAYGDRGAPPVIPANAALVFEVELIKVLN